MENIYTSGQYLEATETWHMEDFPWKAGQIKKIMDRNGIEPGVLAEIGCGSGAILNELSRFPGLETVRFQGYDISPQAIEMAGRLNNGKIVFSRENLLSNDNGDRFDVLMVIDVFEHVPDYIDFVTGCENKATYKIFDIPLDIHVSAVLRNSLTSKQVFYRLYPPFHSRYCHLYIKGCRVSDY